MAKKKNKKSRTHHSPAGINTLSLSEGVSLQNFVQSVFLERRSQFQKNSSVISTVYEGLDLDNVRMKRRISSVISVAEEVTQRFAEICPDIPGMFSLTEDWVTMNTYPVSAYDYVEKYVFSTLGAAIWLLDHLRDTGKIEQLKTILRDVPLAGDVLIPDVWDPCHSQQLLRQMVSIISNRNADCAAQEKAIRKNKSTVTRIYMDRPTAENKIDHTVPSRCLYDQIIALVAPDALTAIENTYKEKYWDWLRRYFLCRAEFICEEQHIRAEIEDYLNQTPKTEPQFPVLTQNRKTLSILNNANNNGTLPAFACDMSSNQYTQANAMTYQNRILYEKQEEFNTRFHSFNRDVGEFPVISNESMSKQYGQTIAAIWSGFEISEPYSMCMAFLSLLDQGSDLPWCYFPSVSLQSVYVCMLPWTRTRFIPTCDDIWEHFDSESGTVVPGPSDQPLSRKIKIPDIDNWYRLQYHDAAKIHADNKDLFSLSHVLYEATGCLMPRNPERYYAALNTLNRYGINTKKANKELLYCMSLLGEAKHQTRISQFPVLQADGFENIPNSAEELQEQISALKEELLQCKQALQDATSEIRSVQNQNAQLKQRLTNHNFELQDLSNLVFGKQEQSISLGVRFPYRTASHIVVFAEDASWITAMKPSLPDIIFFRDMAKANSEALRNADVIWIQPKDMPHATYLRIINEARKSDTPVRFFPLTETTSCAALLAKTDISSC